MATENKQNEEKAASFSNKHHELAQLFCSDKEVSSHLLYVKEFQQFCWFETIEGVYRILSTESLEQKIYCFLKEHSSKNITLSAISDIAGLCRFESQEQVDNFTPPYLALTDVQHVLSTETMQVEEQGIFYGRKPVFFKLPLSPAFLWDTSKFSGSRWETFLHTVLIDDNNTPNEQLVQVVQEMFGYCILNNLDAEACFFLLGEGSNGKTVMLNILRALVGEQFCSSVSLEDMTASRFALSSLIGKKLNVCNEEESSFVKSDKFKALVSGGYFEIDRKFRDPIKVQLNTRFIFATNEMPSLSGFNNAITRRVKIIPFNRIFKDGEKDPQMTKKLLAELPIIAAWALQGAKRLKENSFRFSSSVLMDNRMLEMQNNISASADFIRENYEPQEEFFIPIISLYENFKIWCESRGRKICSLRRFSQEVKRSFEPQLVSSLHRIQEMDGKPVRCYTLKSKQEMENQEKIEF